MDMILTGRPVGAAEALEIGLANRVVADGTARLAAEALAADIARFPQECMRADRASALDQWSLPLDEALQREGRAAYPILERESFAGAARFAAGRGRGGRFDDHDGDGD